MNLLIYIPNARSRPVSAFLGLNFYGNASIHPDPDITLPTGWMRASDEFGVVDHRATEATRGVRAPRWLVERIVARGYALVAISIRISTMGLQTACILCFTSKANRDPQRMSGGASVPGLWGFRARSIISKASLRSIPNAWR